MENLETDEKPKKTFSEKHRSKVLFAVGGLVIGLLIGIIITSPAITGAAVSKGTVEDKVDTYLDQVLGSQGIEYEIAEIEDKGSIYEVDIALTIQGATQDATVAVTKDGKYLVSKYVPLDFEEKSTGGDAAEAKEIPTADVPKVDMYVMSFCPYGNKAENTMEAVYNVLGDAVDWNINFIVKTKNDGTVSSLHGQPEVDQNMREACVLENNGVGAWFDFATYVNDNCGSDGSCWEEAANAVGLDATEIQSCVDEQGFELMQAHEQASNDAGASGSPTLLINGQKSEVVYQYGDSNAYKETICSAFADAPEACGQDAGTVSSATGATGGSC